MCVTVIGAAGAAADSVSNREVFRWRDRQYYGGPKRWLESALRDSTWQDKDDSNEAKKSASTGTYVQKNI